MNKKLDQFVEELQKYYDEANGDYAMSSMFAIGANTQKVYLVERIMDSLNKIYRTNYCLKKPKEEGKC